MTILFVAGRQNRRPEATKSAESYSRGGVATYTNQRRHRRRAVDPRRCRHQHLFRVRPGDELLWQVVAAEHEAPHAEVDVEAGVFVRSSNKIYKPLGVGRVQKVRDSQCKVEFNPTVFSRPPYRSENKILYNFNFSLFKPLQKER